MTHVLLTRSPLSPVPKDWFSLDLHVLSAPPAFVLSQDQTLREEGSPAPKGRRNYHFELSLKGRGPTTASLAMPYEAVPASPAQPPVATTRCSVLFAYAK